jgi:hypothetical protein
MPAPSLLSPGLAHEVSGPISNIALTFAKVVQFAKTCEFQAMAAHYLVNHLHCPPNLHGSRAVDEYFVGNRLMPKRMVYPQGL